MGAYIKPSDSLSKEGNIDTGIVSGTPSYKSSGDNKSAMQAGAAQNSASPRKSAAAFRTISEVADHLGVQQHVLRFWETKFTQVKPLKRGGGRRYYRPEDISLLQAIHHLLYVEGYTIKGVQKLLRDVGKKQIIVSFSNKAPITEEPNQAPKLDSSSLSDDKRKVLASVLAELKDLRGMIKPKK